MGSEVPLNQPIVAQKLDVSKKVSARNKPVCSSVAEPRSEGRANVLPSRSSNIDMGRKIITKMEKNLLRPCGGGSSPTEGENRGSSAAGDCWNKSLKRKRSMGTSAARTRDADHEVKQSTQRIASASEPKQSVQEDSQLGCHVKVKASRAPRSTPGSIMNPSPHFRRTPDDHDGWGHSSNLNKVQSLGVPSNPNQPFPMGPSSLPFAQWAGQRKQKSSRTRRSNLVNLLLGHDKSPILSEGFPSPDTGAKITLSDPIAHGSSRTTSNSSGRPKLKTGNAPSPTVLSESGDSRALDYKTREKGTDNIEEKTMKLVQKVPSVLLPMKKTKISREESNDGVQRQGRSGRVSLQLKSGIPLKENLKADDTVKQLRVGRPGLDLSGNKVNRLSLNKVSECNAIVLSGNVLNSGLPQQTSAYEDC